jgi:hypothetical protein
LPDSGTNSGCSESQVITNNINQADLDATWALENLFFTKPEFLTVVASPRAIPDSEYHKCYKGSHQYRLPKDKKYSLYSSVQLQAGRILGVTIADASSYIARSLQYDYLKNLIFQGNYSGIIVARSNDWSFHQPEAKRIRDKTVAAGYNTVCYTENALENCTKNVKPATSNYKHKNFIFYIDHGSATSWWTTLSYSGIPWLDLPITVGAACSNSNYRQSGSRNFGINMIRRGSLMFLGAPGIGTGYQLKSPEWIIEELGTNSNTTLGILSEVAGYYNFYTLFGDPTLQPKFKHIDW